MTTKLPVSLLKPSGIAGQVLTSNGPNDPPKWAAGGGGGGSTSDRPPSLRADFGGVGDGVANDTAAILAAEASAAEIIYVPDGEFYSPTVLTTQLTKTYIGEGQLRLKTWSGAVPHNRGKFSVFINSRPEWGGADSGTYFGGFDGDYNKNLFCADVRVAGNVHGTEHGAYYASELYPCVVSVYNEAGRNGVTGTAADRTMMLAYHTSMINAGAGDMGAYGAIMSLQGTYEDPVNFLRNKAIGIVGGHVESFHDHGFIQGGETLMMDHGYNVAAMGLNFNLQRDSNAQFGAAAVGGQPVAPNHPWMGFRVNSYNYPIDVGYQASGKMAIGLDLTGATFVQRNGTYPGAAITMAAGQKVFLNAPKWTYPEWSPLWPGVVNKWDNTYFEYLAGDDCIMFVVHGQSAIKLRSTVNEIYKHIKLVDVVNHNYADNATALMAGLTRGTLYHTAGTIKIVT